MNSSDQNPDLVLCERLDPDLVFYEPLDPNRISSKVSDPGLILSEGSDQESVLFGELDSVFFFIFSASYLSYKIFCRRYKRLLSIFIS